MESLSSSDGPLNFRGQWEVIILSDLFTHMKHDQFWIVGDRRSRAHEHMKMQQHLCRNNTKHILTQTQIKHGQKNTCTNVKKPLLNQ